jgi:hypothetical protein
MSKHWNPGKSTVKLEQSRPSRIRREPVPLAEQLSRNAWWESRDWEIRLAIAGIVFFALAITAVVVDVGHLLSL